MGQTKSERTEQEYRNQAKARKRRSDERTAALVLEVERRKKLPGLHDYSYGRLVADTTLEEREQIVDAYRESLRRGGHRRAGGGAFKLPDDREDLRELLAGQEEEEG